jgi:hypothetical protein
VTRARRISGNFIKRFVTGVLLVTLSCVPSLTQAENTRAPLAVQGKAPHNSLAQPAPIDIAPGSTSDYAAREAAAPQLAGFAGGGGGVYIGTGALVVGLVVLIVILVVR